MMQLCNNNNLRGLCWRKLEDAPWQMFAKTTESIHILLVMLAHLPEGKNPATF